MRCPLVVLAVLAVASMSAHAQESRYYELSKGDYPHDVAVGPNGGFGTRVKTAALPAD
jgi:hypothetical protein